MAVDRIYLDHASAWPLRPEARQAWRDAAEVAWADPERRHAEGRRAGELLARATETAAGHLGVRADEVVWTSGGTEAIHLAVLGTARAAAMRGDDRRHLVVSAVEHSAVLRAAERCCEHTGGSLTVVPVDRAGLVDPDEVRRALRPDTLAVHLQHANHEVGAIQPTHQVADACRELGALLHVDACQSVGQLGLSMAQLGADLLSASAAKFGGPRGVGLLAVGPAGRVGALLEGDDRQRRRRAGLQDVAAIAAAAVALHVAVEHLQKEHSAREVLRRRLRAGLAEIDDVEVHGPLADAHPGIVAASALYVDGEALVATLDEVGYAVHSGSSCASTSGRPSHVLEAMGALTHGHMRASVGPATTAAQVDGFVAAFAAAVMALRRTVGR